MPSRRRTSGLAVQESAHAPALEACLVYGLAAYLFLRPLVSGMTYPWSNTYGQFLLGVLFLILVLRIVWSGQSFRMERSGLLLAVFFAWMSFTAHFSVYRGESLRQIYLFAGHLMLFMAARRLAGGKSRDTLLRAVWAGTLVVALYGIYQYFWGLERARGMVDVYYSGEFPPEFMARLMTQRAFSTFVYPPALAGYLVVVIPVIFSMALAESGRRLKWALFSSLPPIFLCLVLTYSKGGLAVLALAGMMFASLWIKFVKNRKLPLAGVFAAAVILLAVFAVLTSADPRTSADAFLGSFRARYHYWQTTPGMLSDYWLTGSGPGTWGVIYPGYRLPWAEETRMAHNNYIQVAVETGVIGITLFLLFWLALASEGLRRLRENRGAGGQNVLAAGILTGIFAFLLQSAVDFTLYVPGIASTVFFLAALAGEPRAGVRQFGLDVRFRTAVSVIAAASLAFFITQARKPMLGDRSYSFAESAAARGDLYSAGLHLKGAAEHFPHDARYYYMMGGLYEAMPAGRIDDAIGMYEKSLALNPLSAMANSALARLYWVKSRGEDNPYRAKAIRQMESAVSCYPVMPSYRARLGRMYHLAGMKEEAVKQYQKALEYESAEFMVRRREVLGEILRQVRTWLEELNPEEDGRRGGEME